MIFALIKNDEKEQLCCVDKIGERAFLIEGFFREDLSELAIESNKIKEIPKTMEQLIRCYDPIWTDDMALYFGSNPELGIALDKQYNWLPLLSLDQIWSPLAEERGIKLLE